MTITNKGWASSPACSEEDLIKAAHLYMVNHAELHLECCEKGSRDEAARRKVKAMVVNAPQLVDALEGLLKALERESEYYHNNAPPYDETIVSEILVDVVLAQDYAHEIYHKVRGE